MTADDIRDWTDPYGDVPPPEFEPAPEEFDYPVDDPFKTAEESYGGVVVPFDREERREHHTKPKAKRQRRLTLPPPETPMPVARELLRLLWTDEQGRETLLRWRGEWMLYRGGAYAPVDAEAIRSTVYLAVEHAVVTAQDGADAKAWTPNDSRINRVVDALKAAVLLDSEIEPDTWIRGATGPAVIYPCTNVLLDIEHRQAIDHDPHFFTLRVPTIEWDPRAVAPEFVKFLNKVWGNDPQARTLALRWLGYVLTGRTDAQKALLLVGPSRAGKGTFMTVAEWLIGTEITASPKLHELGGRFGLESLIGKRLITVGDVRMDGSESSTKLVEALLGLIANDRTNVQRKNKVDWIGRLAVVMMAGTNVMPRLNDPSPATTDRWVILALQRGNAAAPDRGLGKRLEAEKSGILNLALDAAATLPAVGSDEPMFVEPESSRLHRECMQQLSSPIKAFVNDVCHVGDEARVSKDVLYAAYKAWCERTGHYAKSLATLAAELYALELDALPDGEIGECRPSIDGKRVNAFSGICLAGGNDDAPW